MVNGVPRKVRWPNPLRACSPFGFWLGTSLGTLFNTIPPRLFQIMSHYSYLPFLNIYWFFLFTMIRSINSLLVIMEKADITVMNTMDEKKYFGKLKKKANIQLGWIGVLPKVLLFFILNFFSLPEKL